MWANDVSNGIGTGHVVEESAGFLAVNGAIDVSESFLDYLRTHELDELKSILTLSKKIKDRTVTTEQIRLRMATTQALGDNDVDKVVKLQRTKGGRLRFRLAIGGGASIVGDFIANVVAPANSNTVPACLENLTPPQSFRLYDLANPLRSQRPSAESIKWSLARSPANAVEFVNFVEYFLAAGEERMKIREDLVGAQIDKEVRENRFTLDDDDPRVVDKAKDLAKRATKGEILSALRDVQQAAKNDSTWTALFASGDTLDRLVVVKLPGERVTTSVTLTFQKAPPKLQAHVGQVADAAAGWLADSKTIYGLYLDMAKGPVGEAMIKSWREQLVAPLQPDADRRLAEQMMAERSLVAATAASGSVTIPDFWTLGSDDDRFNGLKAAATAPIPFSSTDSAAYHAKKHYEDLVGTEDEAADRTPEARLSAYLESARKTLQNAERYEVSHAQLTPKPGFFVFRTVPAKGPLGRAVRMRAIVVISPTGVVSIATYFRAT